MKRTRRVFDMEVYKNYTLLYFRAIDTGEERYFESPFDELDLDAVRYLVRTSTLITFNGTGYDLPLLLYTLMGRSAEQVKHASDRIIVHNLKPWGFEKEFHITLKDELIDHIDLMDVAPLTGGLKLYAGRMHSRSIQDLPFPPDSIITPEQRPELRAYCANDLLSSVDLYHALRTQLELRESMTAQYGIDLRSKSDAQIAEAVIKSEIEKITGRKLEKPGASPGVEFQYQIPAWMEFQTLDILDTIRTSKFVVGNKGSVLMPKELANKKIRMGTGVYRMGIGGLHSSEETQVREARGNYRIKDFDVASYYPSIVLNSKLYPKHIGENFLTVYQSLVDRRLAAKKAGEKTIAESLKICVNGSFGKLGSQYSVLYSPDLMVQVTVTGQLALLMLIEAFWDILGVEVISANTDGVTVRYEVEDEPEVLAVVKAWEARTGYTMEAADYAGLYSRDVNAYVAVKTNGEVKTKGPYGTGLPLQKNPYANICSRALIDYITLDASIRGTIEACRDIRPFLCLRTVKGGALFEGREVMRMDPNDPTKVVHTWEGQEVGKIVRWYYSTKVTEPLLYKLNGHKVPSSEGAQPLTVISDYHEIPGDLDYDWYVNAATEMGKEVGL